MPDHTSNGMQCHEFDGLLSDALDGVLTGLQLNAFQAHARTCSACRPLFAEVEAGRNWLKDLTEVEPPASLVNNILASTTGVDSQRLRVNVSASQPRSSRLHAPWWERAQAWASEAMQPIWGTVRQPRFAMSFGMAFFALSLALSVLGVKPADLREVSLRPAAIRHTYYSTQARVVRYYENIRFVYEVESRVRELKRTVAPTEAPSGDSAPDKKDRKNDTTQQPEQKQERNYSQTGNYLILASAPLGPSVFDPLNQDPLNPDLPVVSVTTYRRFV
ncbi:MAG: putative transrane transcriptional regulator [Candidatus Sulfotelmatobacter sp.]|nr:putative transrane transcriptional regulator [Candidatus Sulfotelmatobacter sp.]